MKQILLLETEDISRLKTGETIELTNGLMLGMAQIRKKYTKPNGIDHGTPPLETAQERRQRKKSASMKKWRKNNPHYVSPTIRAKRHRTRRTVTGDFPCSSCERSFRTKNAWSAHQAYHKNRPGGAA